MKIIRRDGGISCEKQANARTVSLTETNGRIQNLIPKIRVSRKERIYHQGAPIDLHNTRFTMTTTRFDYRGDTR